MGKPLPQSRIISVTVNSKGTTVIGDTIRGPMSCLQPASCFLDLPSLEKVIPSSHRWDVGRITEPHHQDHEFRKAEG